MKEHITISIRITIALLVITCGIYPMLVWAVGQIAFRHQANGSIIRQNGRVIGSELIAQDFARDRFFHPRPSAASYDATNSSASNLGPTSKKLEDAIESRIALWRTGNPACPKCPAAAGQTGLSVPHDVPADAVTMSASGLDPHISPENALLQAPRVAHANVMPLEVLRDLIRARTESRFIGIFGEPRVNVLLLNLDLLRAYPERHASSR